MLSNVKSTLPPLGFFIYYLHSKKKNKDETELLFHKESHHALFLYYIYGMSEHNFDIVRVKGHSYPIIENISFN